MKRPLWGVGYGLSVAAFTVYLLMNTFVLRSDVQTNAVSQNTAMFETLSASEEPAPTPEETSGDAAGQNSSGTADSEESTHRPSEKSGKKPPKGDHHSPGGRHSSSGGSERGESAGSVQGSGQTAASDAPAEGTQTVLGSYEQDGKRITLTQYREDGTTIYVADVELSTAQSLQTAFAEDTYGRNVTQATSAIAQAHNAILAINGDCYGAQESGYVIRNGVVYRDTASNKELLCVYANGTMAVVQPGTYTAQELVNQGVWQAFSFGPGIVENGSVSVSESDEVGKAMASNPRTAIGMISANHYVFVVSDGRTEESEGLSLYQLARFMEKLGVQTAYNLDGGGSSTLYFNGAVVNKPTTNGRISERGVSDIVYIAA